jgi:hypothetical protein
MRAINLIAGFLFIGALQAQPVPLSGLPDEGTFSLFINEDRVGVITFKWLPDGRYNGSMTLTMAGQSVRTSTEVETDATGAWTRVALVTPLGPATLVRDGIDVTATFRGKTSTSKLKPGTVLFDNYSPALIAHALRSYDAKKGGTQTFPILIAPGGVMEASLTRTGSAERSVGTRDISLTKYTFGLPGVDAIVYAGPDGKVYLVEVPAQKAAFAREGYEALRKPDEADPLLSKPSFEVKVQRAMAPMRDGVQLATDVYLPVTDAKVPVILVRTPYKKDMAEVQGRYYARRGYAYAIQDCRGRFGSQGAWEPFIHERKDGYDAVEWAAKQPWSNGKVGMIGGSYLGWVQWWAAVERPPHLVTIIPNVAPPDPFYNLPYEYGAFFMWGAIWWADVLESNATADLSGGELTRIFEKKFGKLLTALPVIELDRAVLGKENPYWRKWIQHPTNDSYWQAANFLDGLKDLRIPAFHQSGWFDGDGIGTKLNYLRMTQGGAPGQKLIVGPWGHTDTAGRRIGERDFGPQAIIDLQREYLRWFDYHLKGVQNGIMGEPLVRVFAMGSNQWLTGNIYPLPQTRFEKWYLASNGNANTSKGDGRLTLDPPSPATAADKYTYDPGDPTPTPRWYEATEEEDKKVKDLEAEKKKPQLHHEEVIATRKDILVYTTEPFKERYTLVGPVSAVLYASTSARDTDWFARLVEIGKDGQFFELAEGKLRARFRSSMSQPELLTPGKIYEYTLDLWHTGITVPAGARLRIEVASASFPFFSRNLNTGGQNEMETKFVAAQQTIYHDAPHPSHLLLPMIPELTGPAK